MSIFSRLADRGGFAPQGAAAPVMVPKGRGIRRTDAAPEEEELQPARIARAGVIAPRPIVRQTEEEEEPVQPARIARQVEEEEEMQPARLRRQPDDEEEEALQPSRIARQEEEEEEEEEEMLQPSRLRRQPEEEEDASIQPDRIATREEEEEDALQTARVARQPEEEEEEVAAARHPLRRAARPDDPELDPATASPPDIPIDAPEPDDLRARREVSAQAPQAAGPVHEFGRGVPETAPETSPDFAAENRGFASGEPGFSADGPGFRAEAQDRFERPNVVIDHVDVLIHEPSTAPTRAPGPSRSLRARYLRRL